MIAQKTGKDTGVGTMKVLKVIEQYFMAVNKIVDKMDLKHIDPEEIKNLYRRAIYVPGLGKFYVSKKMVEAYHNKHKDDEN